MRSAKDSTPGSAGSPRPCGHWSIGRVQPLVLIIVLAALAIGGGGFWAYRTWQARNPAPDSETEIRLSDSTLRALKRLRSPVEIRFYSLLGEERTPDSLRAFSGRVVRLLSAYEREAGGKIEVTSVNSRSDENLEAAAADGMTVFNLEKGDPCSLGLSVAQKDRKEVLPRITPEWELALEADLTRAILRVNGAGARPAKTAAAAKIALDAGEEVKRAIPNFDSIPLAKGRQILQDAAFKELKAAAIDMQTRLQKARQRLREAQDAGSEAEQAAAVQEVQQLQAAQSEKFREISARLDAQISALEDLKAAPPATP